MKQAFILLISIAVVFVAPGAQGTDHLSVSNTPANVTRTGCGTSLLCVETPEDCDPAGNSTCLFASVNGSAGVAPNGATLSFQLSGTTSGDSFIALLLTANVSEGTSMVFICARTNTSTNPSFFFRTMQRNNTNGMLTSTMTNVTGIQNSITNVTIQCAFDVPGLNATATKKADTTFVTLLGSGRVNDTTIMGLNINLTNVALNLIDPTSNLNTTTPTTSNATTSNNTTSNNTTPTTSNNTTSNNTTPTPSNTTTSNNTTPTPSNTTTSNNTTPTPSNNTTSNNTTPTTSNTTTSNNTTPTPTTPTPPVLVTRTGCETTKLCVEIPEDCDPAGNGDCLFTSVTASTPVSSNGTMLSLELSGSVSGDGYVGVALAASASQGTGTLYVCGRNGTTNGANGQFFFLTVQINNTNGALTVINGMATGIRNLTTDARIQCVFDISVGAPMPRTMDTTSVLQLGTGSVNGSDLGTFTPNVTTPPLDLTNPAANVNPTTSSALVTRTGCGTTKLCVETPEDCDPATNNTCLFTSVNGTAGVAPNGATLSFELSGTSSGDAYVGVALTANASEGTGTLYVCGRNGTTNGVNGSFFFLTVQINNTNGALTVMNGTATGIQNLTSDTRIQCVFNISGVNATAPRKRDTTFVVQLGSGNVNGGTLGTFNANVTTPPLNLLDPASNLNTATTVPATTMSGANRALIPQALPLLLSIFILSILKTA